MGKNTCKKIHGNRDTTEKFIAKARAVHGDKYNYDKSIYVKTNVPLIITCPIDGDFLQKPNYHLGGSNCPYCTNKKLNQRNNFLALNPHIIKEWHIQNGNINPANLSPNSPQIIWLRCLICDEIYNTTCNEYNDGCRCPYCAGKRINIANCLATKNPLLAEEWHPAKNKDLTPYNVLPASDKIVWWLGKCKHEWQASIGNRHLNKNGCPQCKHKNEKEVGELLKKYFTDCKIEHGKKLWNSFKDYESKRFCDYFMENDNVKVVIEYDGEGHFVPVCYGGMRYSKAIECFLLRQKIDKLDVEYCEENNIILWRVSYEDDKEESIKQLHKLLSEKVL